MKKQITTSRIQIGAATLLFLFLILCLAVFSLLSISDAQSSLAFAKRHGAYVSTYYKTDAIAQQWLHSLEQSLEKGVPLKKAVSIATKQSIFASSIETSIEKSLITAIFPLGEEQQLQLTFDYDTKNITSYEVQNQREYEIEQDLPVFTGNDENT